MKSRNAFRILSVGVLLASLGCHTPHSKVAGVSEAEPQSVLLGEAKLFCEIDSRSNGVQRLVIGKGGGIEFDAVVTPIIDGVLNLDKANEAASYRFTSQLAKPAKGHIFGVGDVIIERMGTRVLVELNRYKQPGGAGTPLVFAAGDMSGRGNYVEFEGLAKKENGERLRFRVNFGIPSNGSGKIVPTDANRVSRLLAKTVEIEGPITTVVARSSKR